MSSVKYDRKATSRLHLAFFALAAFDLVTISFTLMLSHRTMSAYESAVETSRNWAARSNEIVELGNLAQQVNAPGNDVFDSGDVARERARRDAALLAFDQQWASIARELTSSSKHEEMTMINAAMQNVRTQMQRMVARADDIFSQIDAGRADLAGRQMASMDRTYAYLTNSIAETLAQIQAVQIRHLQQQVQTAKTLRRLEIVVVGLIFVIVTVVAIYGHHVSQVMRRSALEFNDMLERLERAYGSLQSYADNVAHELRSPVNKMLLASEVTLSRARTKDEYAEALASNMEECQRLSSIVEGILFLARAGSTQVHLERRQIQVGRELEVIRSYFEASAQECGVALTLTCDDTLLLEADRILFQRAVSNLVSNAIAHTPTGGAVRLSASLSGQDIVVEVADTGEGIAAEDQEHVFDRFFRADAVRTAASGRLGLGLPITKSIVDLHDGDISLVSARGAGTRIALRFPHGRRRELEREPLLLDDRPVI